MNDGRVYYSRGQIDAAALNLATTCTCKSTGIYWYVNGVDGNDENDGLTPDTALLKISTAIEKMSASDTVVVGAATYTEPNLTLNKNYCNIYFDLGVTISTPTGLTAFTLSGNSCRLSGYLVIVPYTGQEGLIVTGSDCVVENIEIRRGIAAVRITGPDNKIMNCSATYQTVIGFDIQGQSTKLTKCNTVGTGTQTIGYKINNGADAGILQNCTSSNHALNGFYINTGSRDWHIIDCSSGVGDGPYYDADLLSAKTNFRYDDMVYHETVFSGDGPGSDNLFKITGAVEILYIYGDVEAQLSGDIGNIYLDADDGTNQVDITNSLGINVDNYDAGALLIRTENETSPITAANSDQVRMIENTNFRKPRTSFALNQKKNTDTYIRLVYSGVATSGTVHWHCSWQPLSENGFVEAV